MSGFYYTDLTKVLNYIIFLWQNDKIHFPFNLEWSTPSHGYQWHFKNQLSKAREIAQPLKDRLTHNQKT